MTQGDMDKTVFTGLDSGDAAPDLPAAIRPVATSGSALSQGAGPYVAQQTSVNMYSPGLNPLVNVASGLLMSVIRIRATSQNSSSVPSGANGEPEHTVDIEHLRVGLEAEVRAFESRALASADIEQSQVIASCYVLCTAVDEAVSTSLPGASGEWAKRGLLSTFHNETWGGEKFFQILERCMQQPARNLYILELMYLLLSLGFEGKFGVRDRGPIALEGLRDQIFKQVRLLRGEPAQDLSKKVAPAKGRNRFYAYIPIWLVIAVFVFAIGVTFIGFSTILERHAEPLLDDLSRLAGSSREVQP